MGRFSNLFIARRHRIRGPWNKRTSTLPIEEQPRDVFSRTRQLAQTPMLMPAPYRKPLMPAQDNLKPFMTAAEVNALMATVYPQLNDQFTSYEALHVFPGGCTVRLNADERHLRPGGTVSGPSLFTLADIGGYVCVLSHAGPDALSVTTNLNINFVRKAEAGAIDGHCRILKLGKNLMMFDIDIVAGPEGHSVAHATGTYSIPPKR
jgi:uncharacterized protein (TIGR00369 family)